MNTTRTNGSVIGPVDRMVIDLEATCGIPNQRENSEIIEIGAVFCDAQWNYVDEYWSFVKPIRFAKLTEFCTELTTITQADVDNARGFVEVMDEFVKVIESLSSVSVYNTLFYSWGNYDRNQFIADCKLHGYDYPFGTHRNLKALYAKAINIKRKGMGLGKALNRCSIAHAGIAHRGIDDAKSMQKIGHYMLNEKGILL